MMAIKSSGWKTLALSVAGSLIIILLGMNAFFAKSIVADSKEKDSVLEIKIDQNRTNIENNNKEIIERVSAVETDVAVLKETNENIEMLLQEIRTDVKEIKKK